MKRDILAWGSLPPPYHGSSIMNAATLEWLDKSGRCTWVDPSSSGPLETINAITSGKAYALGLAGLFKFTRIALCRNVSIAYISMSVDGPSFWRDTLAWLSAVLFCSSVVVHLHTGAVSRLADSRLRRTLTRPLLRRSNVWVLSDSFAAHGALQSACEILTVPNGLDCRSNTHATRLEERLEREPPLPIRVIFLSNWVLDKGVDTVVFGARKALERGVPLELAFAGAPYDAEAGRLVEQLAEDYPDQVDVLGPVDEDAKCVALSWADALVLPTRYALEGAPLVVIEALAHGAIPIVTAHAAVGDAAGDSAWIVADDGDLVRAFQRLALASPTNRKRWAAAAVQRWSTCSSGAAYEASLEAALGNLRIPDIEGR